MDSASRTAGSAVASMAAVWFLGLCGLAELVPGLWHSLLPDGGAGVIVGLGLTQHAELIVRVFAWLARL